MEELIIYQPCTTGAAFQGIPKKSIKLNMNKVKEVLEKEGYKIELFVKDLIIVKKHYIINIYKSGKILVKDIKDEKKAKKIIEKIYEKILTCA